MIGQILKIFGADCPPNSGFLGFPNWYRKLECGSDGSPMLTALGDVWKIVGNVTEIALRVAGLVAIAFIIFGGITYIMSQGNPERITQAKDIIVNAVIGLVIAIMATAIVSFIAGSF